MIINLTWKTWSNEGVEEGGWKGIGSALGRWPLFMAGTRTDLLAAGVKRWDSTSLEYLALLISLEWSTSVLSGLLGTITERGSPGMQTAVAAGEWHISPLIFLLVLRFMPIDLSEEEEEEGIWRIYPYWREGCWE